MAQNFRRYTLNGVGTAAADIPDGANFDPPITLTMKYDAPIPAGGALQVMDGGAKIVVQSGDRLYVKSDTAASVDVWVSAVDAIST